MPATSLPRLPGHRHAAGDKVLPLCPSPNFPDVYPCASSRSEDPPTDTDRGARGRRGDSPSAQPGVSPEAPWGSKFSPAPGENSTSDPLGSRPAQWSWVPLVFCPSAAKPSSLRVQKEDNGRREGSRERREPSRQVRSSSPGPQAPRVCPLWRCLGGPGCGCAPRGPRGLSTHLRPTPVLLGRSCCPSWLASPSYLASAGRQLDWPSLLTPPGPGAQWF